MISLGPDYVNPSEEFEQFSAKTVDAAREWKAPEFRSTNSPDRRRFDVRGVRPEAGAARARLQGV